MKKSFLLILITASGAHAAAESRQLPKHTIKLSLEDRVFATIFLSQFKFTQENDRAYWGIQKDGATIVELYKRPFDILLTSQPGANPVQIKYTLSHPPTNESRNSSWPYYSQDCYDMQGKKVCTSEESLSSANEYMRQNWDNHPINVHGILAQSKHLNPNK